MTPLQLQLLLIQIELPRLLHRPPFEVIMIIGAYPLRVFVLQDFFRRFDVPGARNAIRVVLLEILLHVCVQKTLRPEGFAIVRELVV